MITKLTYALVIAFAELDAASGHFLLAPPPQLTYFGMVSKRCFEQLRNPGNGGFCRHFPEPPSHEWLAGFDETKKSVRILVVVAAPDPKRKRVVPNGNAPTPILRAGFVGLESSGREGLDDELRQPLSETAGIDLILLVWVRRKRRGSELHVSLHRVSILNVKVRRFASAGATS